MPNAVKTIGLDPGSGSPSGSLGGNAVKVYEVSSGPSYDPDALALFARMEVDPTDYQKSAINTFILEAKASGWWQQCDLIVIAKPLFLVDGDSVLLNLRQDRFGCTKVGNVTLDSSGSTGDGTTGYWDTGLSPLSPGVSFSSDNNNVFVATTSDTSANTVEIGNAQFTINVRNLSGQLSVRSQSALADFYSVPSTTGLTETNRDEPSGYNILKDGIPLQAVSRSSDTIALSTFYVGARNNSGDAANFSTRTLTYWGLGASITAQQSSHRATSLSVLWGAL